MQPVHVSVQLVQSLPPVHWQLYSVHKHITITAITNHFFEKPHVLKAIVFCNDRVEKNIFIKKKKKKKKIIKKKKKKKKKVKKKWFFKKKIINKKYNYVFFLKMFFKNKKVLGF
jgi:hypothetical protein